MFTRWTTKPTPRNEWDPKGGQGVWSITGLTGRLRESYKLIMHVHTMRSYTRPHTIHASVPQLY